MVTSSRCAAQGGRYHFTGCKGGICKRSRLADEGRFESPRREAESACRSDSKSINENSCLQLSLVLQRVGFGSDSHGQLVISA